MIRVAINGYGRIGRNILRAVYERRELWEKVSLVAINDLGNVSTLAHLTRYDSVHGHFGFPVEAGEGELLVDGDRIRILSERDPAKLPWRELNVDVVFECTGLFTQSTDLSAHLEAGAKRVLLSAPGKGMDATVVFGVNHDVLKPEYRIVSNASCTTNCLAPLVKPLHEALGITSGFMTTVHAYTNDQHLTDSYHSDLYRARSATQSLIPTRTGAAAAIGEVVPELDGRLDGIAVRAPVVNVSLLDLTFTASRATSEYEVNAIMEAAASQPELANVLHYSTEPLVSVDFNHSPYSCNFDASHTRVNDTLVKVMAWYDNEWGFSNRMLDTSLAWFGLGQD